MSALLAAMLLAGQPQAPLQVDLATLLEQAVPLDGRLVVFDAYVRLVGERNGHALLYALPGEAYLRADGQPLTMCSVDEDAGFAVSMRSLDIRPLGRRAARSGDGRYAGVRIRGIFRNRGISYPLRRGGVDLEWPGLFENARIERVTGTTCETNFPEGAHRPEQ